VVILGKLHQDRSSRSRDVVVKISVRTNEWTEG